MYGAEQDTTKFTTQFTTQSTTQAFHGDSIFKLHSEVSEPCSEADFYKKTPTQFKIFVKISRTRFPRNQVKNLIS